MRTWNGFGLIQQLRFIIPMQDILVLFNFIQQLSSPGLGTLFMTSYSTADEIAFSGAGSSVGCSFSSGLGVSTALGVDIFT